jgi:soluble lytic murein transglycosylase-like protein
VSDEQADGDSAAHADGLRLRGGGQRRHDERRTRRRKGRERRRGDRRRAGMRTLLLTAAALSTPHAAKVRAIAGDPPGRPSAAVSNSVSERPLPSVSVAIDSVIAVDPRHAYDDLIAEAAERYRLDPLLIRSVMQAESSFNALAVSPVGAMGLMQLMPEVAEELGADDPMDPRQNVMAGARYLRRLLDAHRGNVRLALASYNAGPGAVARYGTIPPYRETRNYVKKITGLIREARASND